MSGVEGDKESEGGTLCTVKQPYVFVVLRESVSQPLHGNQGWLPTRQVVLLILPKLPWQRPLHHPCDQDLTERLHSPVTNHDQLIKLKLLYHAI